MSIRGAFVLVDREFYFNRGEMRFGIFLLGSYDFCSWYFWPNLDFEFSGVTLVIEVLKSRAFRNFKMFVRGDQSSVQNFVSQDWKLSILKFWNLSMHRRITTGVWYPRKKYLWARPIFFFYNLRGFVWIIY